jgi:hypothetical protein
MAAVTDECDPGPTLEDPSPEDFEAAAEELPPVGTRSALVRILRAAGVLFVVIALLFYLVGPFYDTFRRVQHDWPRPFPNTRPTPVAPEPTSTPVRRV